MLSSWKASASAACTIARPLLNGKSTHLTQQTRSTVILKRKYPIRLYKKGGQPHKMNHKDYIYEVVENTDLKKQPPLEVILTQFVEGYGEKGDKISLKQHKAYTEFLLPGLAVYASPDNLKKYWTDKADQQKTYSSLNAPLTINILQKCCLLVYMSLENPWVLEKWHIRTNFRKMGVILTEESITMPEKEISGPNLDNQGKEFYITVTINKTEQAKVRCRLFHDTYDLSKQLELEPEYWKIPGEAIFPEDQEVLDSLPRPKWEESTKKATKIVRK